MTETPIEIWLIRHAPVLEQGKLLGRTDVDIDLDGQDLGWLSEQLRTFKGDLYSSPALRARKTAAALGFENPGIRTNFWEQDFGAHEGMELSKLPNWGELSLEEIAGVSWPDGESFLDVYARVQDEIMFFQNNALIFAHAGTIRAALGLALGVPFLGLKFQIENLSLTKLRKIGREFAILTVNETGGLRG